MSTQVMKKTLSSSLDENIKLFEELFQGDDTLLFRRFGSQSNVHMTYCILYITGMVNENVITDNILHPLAGSTFELNEAQGLNSMIEQVIDSAFASITPDLDVLIEAVLDGQAILIVDGTREAIIISTREVKTRAIEEPDSERVLRGPKEGFTESIADNVTMLRRKLKTVNLKLNSRVIGTQTHTTVYVCYLEGIANPQIIEELNKRLNAIELDGVLDSGYIQELIRDSPHSIFRTVGTTERPDVVAGKLLEGRIALLVDGTPVALTIPFIFVEYFQAPDDYYLNFYFSSIGRMLRILGFLITISIASLYSALVTFHQEMIPSALVFNIYAARQGVPFPTIVEAIGMLIVFEILRETGLRMPTLMGQALSILGALVIGQAAVEAKFISAPIVIVIALSGITGLMVPKLKGAVILIRFGLIGLSGILGLYGYVFGLAGILIHLFELRSFGVPYMYRLMLLHFKEDIKDTAIRAPWWYMRYRPGLIALNKVRNTTKKRQRNKQ